MARGAHPIKAEEEEVKNHHLALMKTQLITDCNITINLNELFCNRKVLELGAGSSGLPYMTL